MVFNLSQFLDCKKKTPSTPEFNFAARSSSSLTATIGRHRQGYKNSSFMNTPLGNIQTFDASAGFSSTTVNSLPRGLKRSASTPNVSASLFERRTRPQLGSDEKKIIAGFVNTPVMVVKTPLAKIISRGSPLQKGTPLSASLQLLPSESELPPSYVRETSSLELLETSTFDFCNKSEMAPSQAAVEEVETDTGKVEVEAENEIVHAENQKVEAQSVKAEYEDVQAKIESNQSEEASKVLEQADANKNDKKESAFEHIPQSPVVPQPVISLSLSPQLPRPQSSLSATLQEADLVLRQLAQKRVASEQAEYAAFQQSLRAKARAEQERIEALAAANAKRLQKLKAGPTVLPAKSVKPLTMPSEFRFEYESRVQLKKLAKPAAVRQEDKENDHSTLRRSKSFSSLPSIGGKSFK